MFTSTKFFNDTTKSKVLEQSKKGFSDTMFLVGTLIERNNKEDLDLFFHKKTKHENDEIEAKTKITYLDSDKTMQPAFMNPNACMYMEKAILPSPTYWGTVKQEIEGSSKKEEKTYKNAIKAKPFSLISYNSTALTCNVPYKLVKISAYNFTVNTKIPGLNQCKQNPNIFFSVSPNYGYEHRIKQLPESLDERTELYNEKGREYLADIINQVEELRPHCQISCIVLGKRALAENWDVYTTADKLIEDNNQRNIGHYYLPKEKSKAKVNVGVYNLDAHAHTLNLTDKDLETLHSLALGIQKRNGGDAIIVHCQQGLDRTGMLIFAFLLFEHYEHYFTGENRAEKIYAAYLSLLESRSPTALTKIPDLVNAFYLAHALKAIDLEKNCFIDFQKLASKDKRDSSSALSLMQKLNEAKTYTEKLRILDEEVIHLEKMQDYSPSSPEKILTPSTDKLKILDLETKPLEKTQNILSDALEDSRFNLLEVTQKTTISDEETKSPVKIHPLVDKPKALDPEIKLIQKTKSQHRDEKIGIYKKRPSSDNYISPPVNSFDEIKKSNSVPEDLNSFREARPTIEPKAIQPEKASSKVFAKKVKNRRSESLDIISSTNDSSSKKKKFGQESKSSLWNKSSSKKSVLTTIPENEHDESSDNNLGEMEKRTLTNDSAIITNSMFSRKSKKRYSDSLKEPKIQNPSEKYINKLKYFRDVVAYSKETNETLQERIKPDVGL